MHIDATFGKFPLTKKGLYKGSHYVAKALLAYVTS